MNILKLAITVSTIMTVFLGSGASANPLTIVNVETHYSGNSYLRDAVKYRLVYCIDKYCDRATIPSVPDRSSADIVEIVRGSMAKTLIKTFDPALTCGSVSEESEFSADELINYLRVSDHPLGNWGEEPIAKLRDYLDRSAGHAHITYLALEGCDAPEYSYFMIYSAKTGYVTIINLSAKPEFKRQPFYYE